MFQDLIDKCCRYSAKPVDDTLKTQDCLKPALLSTLPKATVKVHSGVYEVGLTVQNFQTIQVHISAALFQMLCSVLFSHRLQTHVLCFLRMRSISKHLAAEKRSASWWAKIWPFLRRGVCRICCCPEHTPPHTLFKMLTSAHCGNKGSVSSWTNSSFT